MLAVSEVPFYAEGVTTKTSLRPGQSRCDATSEVMCQLPLLLQKPMFFSCK
jgi:hypothetical protein